MEQSSTPVRLPDLARRKLCGEKITMLTAYDATMARLLDAAGIDVLLVGDSLGMVVLGYEDTIPVTMEDILHHTRAVVRGARRALIVADLPFLSYQVSESEAVRNAGRLLQDGGAAAVKLEGGAVVAPTLRRIVQTGIPVMGHIGLTPQSVRALGGYRYTGRTAEDAERLLGDARALQDAGAFSLVLECVADEAAQRITSELEIPTIGIGAGPHCDGQVLVSYDMSGLFDGFTPRFVKRYADVASEVSRAAREYADDVKNGRFPAREHSFSAGAL